MASAGEKLGLKRGIRPKYMSVRGTGGRALYRVDHGSSSYSTPPPVSRKRAHTQERAMRAPAHRVSWLLPLVVACNGPGADKGPHAPSVIVLVLDG